MQFLKIFTLSIPLILMASTSSAQLNIDDFQLGGAAQKINDLCIRLVPDFQYTAGSAWYKKPIDLSAPFEMEVCLVLGEKDLDGADGIVFVFHPNFARTGFRGEGMGFAGLIPSLGIEFDTYLNYHLYDPEDDHIAVMVNGQTYHGTKTFQPVTVPNLEDGGRHVMRITWDPQAKQLLIFLDGENKVVYDSDIVTNIFGGNSVVYWGVTAATGRLSNNHEICIKKLIFTDASKSKTKGWASIGPLLEEENTLNAELQFKPNTNELYPASMKQLEKLAEYLTANPTQKIDLVGHSKSTDQKSANSKLSYQRMYAVRTYLKEKGVGLDQVIVKSKEDKDSKAIQVAVLLND